MSSGIEYLLEEFQQAVETYTKRKMLLEKAEQRMYIIRDDIKRMYGGHDMAEPVQVEEPDPNEDPEEVPPVTDMEEVQKVTGRGGKPKRIFMRNTETGVEKEFPSKTRAAQFLDITQQYLAKILKDGGTFKGWWITEVADTPGA